MDILFLYLSTHGINIHSAFLRKKNYIYTYIYNIAPSVHRGLNKHIKTCNNSEKPTHGVTAES